MELVYISLGSNLGDKQKNILEAISLIEIEGAGKIIAHSSFYNTAPVGFVSENQFINSACILLTGKKPKEVLEITKKIERDMGRLQKSKNDVYSDRLIDIDILLFGDLIAKTDSLIIPHPKMHERTFVLTPLAEIAGNVVHPSFNETIRELLNRLLDKD